MSVRPLAVLLTIALATASVSGQADENSAELAELKALRAKVLGLFRAGRSREALPLAKQAYELSKRVYGPEHAETAAALGDIAAQLINLREFRKAVEINERALAILTKAFGRDDPRLTTILNNMGAVYRFLGEQDKAIECMQRTLRINEKAFGRESPKVVDTLLNLSVLVSEARKYDDAVALCKRAVAIQETAAGKDSPAIVNSLAMLGGAQRRAGDLARAQATLERTVRIIEKAGGPNHMALVVPFSELAAVYAELGARQKREEIVLRSVRILDAAGKLESEQGIAALAELGAVHDEAGRYEQAAREYRRAIRLCRTSPTAPVDMARILHHFAQVLGKLERYDEARRNYEEAAKLLEKAMGPVNSELAANINDRALLLREQGQYREAIRLFRHARAMLIKTLGENHKQVGICTNNLAAVLMQLDETEEANRLLLRSVAILERAEGAAHPDTLRHKANLAIARINQGDPGGVKLLEEAIRDFETTLSRDHPAVGGYLNALANAYRTAGRYKEAIALTRRALEIEGQVGKQRLEYAAVLQELAFALKAAGEFREAAKASREALSIVELYLRAHFAGLDAAQRVLLVGKAHLYLQLWLTLAPHAGKSGYTEALRFKGIAARAGAAERRLAREAGGEAAARVEELRAAERRLATLANSMPFNRKQRAKWQERYAAAAAERERLGLALARDFAPLREGMERLDIGLKQVQESLRRDEVLVDYLRFSGGYVAFIVRRTGTPVRVGLGSAEPVDEAVRAFAERAADPKTKIDDADWLAAGQRVFALVIAPLRDSIGTKTKALRICPDASLASVPFAALPTPGKPGRFLIDEYELASISMAQDLVAPKTNDKPGRGALLVGGVNYSKPGAAGKRPDPIVSLDNRRAPRGRTFTPLPETLREVEFLAQRLGSGSRTLVGSEATEAGLRREVHGRRILHVATHGFVRDDLLAGLRKRRTKSEWLGVDLERRLAAGYDPMLLAGLAMAGANAGDGGAEDDGILTAAEVSYLDLRGVELVTLSACETALGRAESGEGVVGLVQAFQMAGARTVIASLWQVDDEATRLLMQQAYEGLLRRSKPLTSAAALRRAALHVRGAKGKGGRSFSGPAYWAAFVAYGR